MAPQRLLRGHSVLAEGWVVFAWWVDDFGLVGTQVVDRDERVEAVFLTQPVGAARLEARACSVGEGWVVLHAVHLPREHARDAIFPCFPPPCHTRV